MCNDKEVPVTTIFQFIGIPTKNCRCSNSKAHIFIFKGQYFPLPVCHCAYIITTYSFVCRTPALQSLNKMNINIDNGKPRPLGRVL